MKQVSYCMHKFMVKNVLALYSIFLGAYCPGDLSKDYGNA